MEPPIVVEILDRIGKVKERHVIRQFPCRIGRSYNNDIIIDDPYVSPNHIELILDGNKNVIVNDLKSDNGTFSLTPLQRQDTFTIGENQRIRLGYSELRLRSSQFPIHQTLLIQNSKHRIARAIGSMLLLPLVWMLTAGVIMWQTYLSTTTDTTLGQLIRITMPILLFLPGWAFVWSIVSKIVMHKFYYTRHAIWSSLLLLVLYVTDVGHEYLEFMTNIDSLAALLGLLTSVLLTALLFYGHLRMCTSYSRKRAGVAAAITGFLLVLFAESPALLAQLEFNNQPQFSGYVKPPQYVTQSPMNIDDFFSKSAELKNFNGDSYSD